MLFLKDPNKIIVLDERRMDCAFPQNDMDVLHAGCLVSSRGQVWPAVVTSEVQDSLFLEVCPGTWWLSPLGLM
jgi:hypothetical protein